MLIFTPADTTLAVTAIAAAAAALLMWIVAEIIDDKQKRPAPRQLVRHRRGRGGHWKKEPGAWSDEDLAALAAPSPATVRGLS